MTTTTVRIWWAPTYWWKESFEIMYFAATVDVVCRGIESLSLYDAPVEWTGWWSSVLRRHKESYCPRSIGERGFHLLNLSRKCIRSFSCARSGMHQVWVWVPRGLHLALDQCDPAGIVCRRTPSGYCLAWSFCHRMFNGENMHASLYNQGCRLSSWIAATSNRSR